jgi:hypothetical protein
MGVRDGLEEFHDLELLFQAHLSQRKVRHHHTVDNDYDLPVQRTLIITRRRIVCYRQISNKRVGCMMM